MNRTDSDSPDPQPARRTFSVRVERGYHPSQLAAPPGEPLRVAFERREQGSCSREVVFPGLGLRRALPFGETVVLDLPALPPGDYAFTCGMGMLRGVLRVAPA